MIFCSFFYHHVLSRKDTFFLITIDLFLIFDTYGKGEKR